MASFSYSRAFVMFSLLAATATAAFGQSSFVSEGTEFGISGTLPGEQVHPHVSIKPGGGYLVWRDNITDGDGYGISARKLDGSLSGTLSVFRVNENGSDDQERPVVTLLNGGGAIFAWESGKQSFQHIRARVLSSSGTWLTGDLSVNTSTNTYQMETAIATLTNGNAVVVWSSFNQVSSTSLRDVYFQILTPTGAKFGGEVLVNQTTLFNQRTAAITPLSDGRFAVVWVSEQQRFANSADIFARIFGADGLPVGSEFLVNSSTNACANPSVTASLDGGFMVAWSEKDMANTSNGWDINVRPISSSGFGGVTRRINNYIYGDQFVPRIAGQGNEFMVTWSSLGQDGSREGVYGRFLSADGSTAGQEFRVNTTTMSQQLHPVVASDGASRFLAIWSGFVGGAGVFDLFAQRYVSTNQPLLAPSAPMVTVLSSNTLSVSWPAVSGLPIANYEVFADGSATPTAVVTNTYWNATALAPASQHSYRFAYVLTDGRRSPLSGATTNTTYGGGATWGGIPQEWMIGYFGNDIFSWPSPFIDSDGDGASNRNEFLAGTNPNDPNSVLKVRLQPTMQGLFLNWNTQPGLMYQVWSGSSPTGPWTKTASPRFAAGTVDSIYVGGSNAAFYQIERLR